MIYAKILNKVIFELDQFLDLSDLELLNKKISLQIAKNKDKISVVYSGPADPRYRTWLDESIFLEVKNSWVRIANQIPSELKNEWENLNHDQQLYYTLLTSDSRSLNYGLSLRSINQTVGGNSGKFHLKHLSSQTIDSGYKTDFNFLFEWIERQNIFQEIGRCQIFINPEGNYTPIHRDYGDKSRKDQFVWIRFNKHKNFFLYDEEEKQKYYIQGHACTFDNFQWHGNDPSEFLGYSIRFDGIFSENFLNKTGLDQHFLDKN